MRAGTRPTLPLSSSSTSRKTSATVAVRLSSWVRSPRTVRTRTPCAASSSDRALAACSSLLPYASTQSKPFAASRCAVASPIPPEPPVMMATVAASAEQCTAAARCARPARGGGATKADTLHASGRRSASRIGWVRALLALTQQESSDGRLSCCQQSENGIIVSMSSFLCCLLEELKMGDNGPALSKLFPRPASQNAGHCRRRQR